MNAAYETFSEHSGTSTYDIAFLTISDISNQVGISKSKLYKDIREGKLLAEKSLDETLVVSPRALHQAYREIDLSALLDAEFPEPDFLDDGDSLTDVIPNGNHSGSVQQSQPWVQSTSIDSTDLAPEDQEDFSRDAQSQIEESSSKTHSGSQMARIVGFSSVVVICSAILVSVFANI